MVPKHCSAYWLKRSVSSLLFPKSRSSCLPKGWVTARLHHSVVLHVVLPLPATSCLPAARVCLLCCTTVLLQANTQASKQQLLSKEVSNQRVVAYKRLVELEVSQITAQHLRLLRLALDTGVVYTRARACSLSLSFLFFSLFRFLSLSLSPPHLWSCQRLAPGSLCHDLKPAWCGWLSCVVRGAWCRRCHG